MGNERRSGLGRGLGALIQGDASSGQHESALRDVALNAIQANPRQPRTVFDDDELEGLAASIKEVGLLQPIVVRPLHDGRWELVAGERRLRAARRAGLATIAVIVRETDDADLLKEALIENIHRVQLNPLEEAAAYGQLLDDFGVTQEELAKRLGKGRPTITNALRLLSLPPSIQRRVAAGVLSAGHAKALLGLATASDQEAVAGRIVAEGLSVRATEELVRLRYLDANGTSSRGGTSRRPLPPSMERLQDDLADALGQDVKIKMGTRKGTLAIAFRTPDDLTKLVDVIARGLGGPGPLTDAPVMVDGAASGHQDDASAGGDVPGVEAEARHDDGTPPHAEPPPGSSTPPDSSTAG